MPCGRREEDDVDSDGDGDGLTDSEEADRGTDPDNPDSDGDTYQDNGAIAEGKDPADPESRIYIGYWPCNPDKDLIVDAGFDGDSTADDPLPRFAMLDPFGEEVDFYDFAGQGKPIILDDSGLWCYSCQEMAAWLDHQPGSFYECVLEALMEDFAR